MILMPCISQTEGVTRGGGLPLDRCIRGFMEARFGTDLGGVRIHTGLAATRLCGMLNARALTLGDDILFAEGMYVPSTMAGLWLLAHELVHVLQQRAARGSGHPPAAPEGFLVVGDEDDVLEHEADRLAAEVLEGRLRSCITPDSGVIRRAITMRDGAVSASTEHTGATPGINDMDNKSGSIYGATILLHLTRNSKHDATKSSVADYSAMKVTGAQQVKADPKDTEREITATWGFHILQFFYDMARQAWYAGETASDGSMKLDFAGPANYKGYGKYVLDADPDHPTKSPYAEQTSRLELIDQQNGIWNAIVEFDDHPLMTYPLVLKNFAASQRDNYLYKIYRKFKILTTFVAVDQKLGLIYPLFYFTWGALYDASIRWSFDKDGKPFHGPASFSGSYFDVGQVKSGGPKDIDLMAMVTNAARYPDNKYNKLSMDAFAAVIMSQANSQDVEASAGWSSTVPTDHFK